ncbi:hypothetical protein KDA14_01700 [Candidatus Saccharibacteria bacterium]|nr:hypothetical protein [Candidatus Saccharibacteria bacterium]
MKSICILGRQPALGLAELESLYGTETVSLVAPNVAALELEAKDINFPRLGGSTRLARVLAEIPGSDWKSVEKYLAKTVPEHLQYVPEGKLQLGLSAFGFDISPAKLTATGLTLKKIIRAAGRSVRLVPNNELELNTAQVLHNHLTGKTGWELLLVRQKDTTILAQTYAVQDIDSYTLRDRGRPKRDARVGMLPPKLAQIIINLATSDTNPLYGSIVLDPFCGTGVVLQEATWMGFDVYGSDLDPRMVQYTDENLMWFLEQPGCPVEDIRASQPPDWRYFSLEEGDATTHQWSPRPNIVACETYLGRTYTAQPERGNLSQNITDVNTILTKFLRNVHPQLAPGSRLCLAVPAWQTKPNTFRHLPLVDQISDLGYNRVEFERVRNDELIYYRSDQIVARQLLVLTRK